MAGTRVLEREWVSLRDPEDATTRYTFDVSYLLSGYTCIYGAGCQGTRDDRPDDVVGCCLHGAYYVDRKERRRVEKLVKKLGPEFMQYYDDAREGGVTEIDDEGEAKTRVIDEGCIFLNRADFAKGKGCAFHHYAIERGEHHATHKPTVCWQLPLHRTIDETVGNDGNELTVHTITAYERGTWGEGGAAFFWWCTEDPAAFTGKQPVYISMATELTMMVGPAVYAELVEYLSRKRRARSPVTFLPMVT